jgi:hypothetical protein
MLGPGSPMCQFMDASLRNSGANARRASRRYHVFTDDLLHYAYWSPK